MQGNSIKVKILLTIFTIGILLWIGGAVIRMAIAYDIFVPGSELTLKSYYSDDIRIHTVEMYAMTGLYTGIGFGCAFISAIFLCVSWRKELKKRGWLFMAFLFLFLSTPFELYMIYLDLMLNLAIWSNKIKGFNDWIITGYFTIRFTKLAIPSALSFFSIITSIIMIIWRPLDKSN